MMEVNNCDVFMSIWDSQTILHYCNFPIYKHDHTLILSTSAPLLTVPLPAYICKSVSKRFSTLSDTQTPLLPIFPLAFIQVSFIHDLPYTFHPVFLRSSSCSLLFWHPLQCYFGKSPSSILPYIPLLCHWQQPTIATTALNWLTQATQTTE